tara:strand:- start:82 stop:477 length:396 start_codon:yes stop_codon:yes gene_type:complete
MKGVRREEPDSSEGQLGEDFHHPKCFAISNDEARLMLHTKRMKEPLKTFAKAFSHSEEYVSRVSQFAEKEDICEARLIMLETGFSKFEMAQLLNFCPGSVDEAWRLVPSLKRADPRTLSDALEVINEYRKP